MYKQASDLKFTFPARQVFFMIAVTVAAGVGCYVLFPSVKPIFLANLFINGVILSVFIIGLVACFWQIWQLVASINWITGFTEGNAGQDQITAPRLLTTMARLLHARGSRANITPTSARSILDSVGARIDEMRDITRYIVNLLIFLGLLGTFFGLATTIPAVVETIKSLNPQAGEGSIGVFQRLIDSLEVQLGGMGTAFTSSLLGLTGSLIVGLLELFASHGQNRFYRELEDWLSTITRLSLSHGDGDEQTGADQGVLANAIMQMVDQMDYMRRMLDEAEQSRQRTGHHFDRLAEAITKQTAYSGKITEFTERQTKVIDSIKEVVALLADVNKDDPASRMSLQGIEAKTAQLVEEFPASIEEMTRVLSSEFAKLAKTIDAKQAASDNSDKKS